MNGSTGKQDGKFNINLNKKNFKQPETDVMQRPESLNMNTSPVEVTEMIHNKITGIIASLIITDGKKLLYFLCS